MRTMGTFLAALVLAVVVLGGVAGRAVACSCVPPVSLAEAVERSPELAVFVGRVVALGPDEGTGGGVATVVVEGRFRGPLLPSTIGARYGSGSDCTIGMVAGERYLFTARLEAGGTWLPGLCDPQGVLGTPEGDRLLEAAVRTFGPMQPVAAPPVEAPDGPDPVLLGTAVVLAALLGVAVLGGAVALARRRRPPEA